MPGPRSTIIQRPGPSAAQTTLLGVAGAGARSRRRRRGAPGAADREVLELASSQATKRRSGPAPPITCRPPPPAGSGSRRTKAEPWGGASGPQERRATRAALAAVLARAAVHRRGRGCREGVVAGAAVDHGGGIADEDVVEGGAFEASKRKSRSWPSPMPCGRRARPTPRLPCCRATSVAKEASRRGRGRHPCGRSRSRPDQVVVAGAAAERVDAEAAGDFVGVSRRPRGFVVAEVADDAVGRRRRRRQVVAAAAADWSSRCRCRVGRCRARCGPCHRRRGSRSRRARRCRGIVSSSGVPTIVARRP